MIETIQKALNRLKRRFERKYGEVIFDVGAMEECKRKSAKGAKTQKMQTQKREREESAKDVVYLEGRVLLPSQKEKAEKAVRKIHTGDLKNNIKVLTDQPLCFGEINEGVANVFKRPLTIEERKDKLIRKENRHTQIVAGDHPFKILKIKKWWMLIQMNDGTAGWVRKRKVVRGKAQAHKRTSAQAHRGVGSKKEFQKICDEYLGIHYLLGGTSNAGIDCSGLVQRIFKRAFGIILPKKSTAQIKACQKEIAETDQLLWGDLLFFIANNGKTTPHIGICYDEKKKLILHSSCLKNGSVKVEPLKEMGEWYKLVKIGRRG